ncbi:glycine--tRNA ligase subunit beta [Desulfocurvibacter africanus]|uniref:glycine--tRNA ligase subunit beta n=1 Tax=Desulfocurvibacter africanus TaxID=873 RepID=UPI00042416E9|nr:glycine--tRNA ligase subunit beta [Desulfocurvibacter africanus]
MPQFVFEIGTEEMPARFVPALSSELAASLFSRLAEAKIDCGEIHTYGTPRRLVAMVADLAESQRSEVEEVTGPPARIAFDAEGKLTKAGLGFAGSQGVPPESLYTVETAKGAYLATKKATGGARSIDILPALCQAAVSALNFPKKMHWGSGDFTFGRPIRWIVAMLGSEIIRFSLAGVESSNLTWGHRVMGAGPFAIARAEDYQLVIREQGKVVLDPTRRLDIIRKLGNASAEAEGGSVVWKQSLLEEVVNLVEHPIPVLASFDKAYLELPREVLLTSMESHQKSFGVQGKDGKLLPFFLTVINLEPKDEDLVRKGWERVLKARLEDARFFWKGDLSRDFDYWCRKLDSVTFLGPLGSMGDKSRRLERLCGYLAQQTSPELLLDLSAAGLLAKCDLVTDMVGEFDTLQGIMGGIYARKKGKGETVAQAIAEQYLPTGPDSPTPQSLAGALLAMADKADTLAGTFGLDMVPTGAADPYALRRQALGICRIVIDHGLRLSLTDLLRTAHGVYGDVQWKLAPDESLRKLLDFFAQRIKAYFTAKGHETLVVEACLGAGIDDIWAFSRRLEALSEFSRGEGFEQAVLTFKRAANIIRKQGSEAGVALDGAYEKRLLESEHERELAQAIEAVSPRFDALWAQDDYASLMSLLAELRPYVDRFFDNVMVMAEDPALRLNRLNLLQRLVSMLGRLADFNALQV